MISFGVLFAAFYEMSGGEEFDGEALRLSRIDVEEMPAQEPARRAAVDTADGEVSRVALNLTPLTEMVAPEKTLETVPARQRPAQPEAQIVTASASADDATGAIENPRVSLPSLMSVVAPSNGEGVTITPVDLGSGTPDNTVQGRTRDVREVTGNRVNVRGGPGTNFSVVNRLTRGEAVVILDDPGEGWVMMRPVDGGPVGWMADFLLSDAG
ncbi:MAG: SH3 domain-containing protein [Pseudomonadota bacterium]